MMKEGSELSTIIALTDMHVSSLHQNIHVLNYLFVASNNIFKLFRKITVFSNTLRIY